MTHALHQLVILTGAGISAESGISTFRDANGLWEQHKIEEVATPEAFYKNPKLVWKFYSLRRKQASEVKPNTAHYALAEFAKENEHQIEMHLITQNVDVLHQRADSYHRLDPICMHGSLHQSRCSHCETIYFDDHSYISERDELKPVEGKLCNSSQKASENYLHHYSINYTSEGLPLSPCCQKLIRPHIVWFGEVPFFMEKIERLLQKAQTFVTIGTSGSVYPAASFLQYAKLNGAKSFCINKETIPQNQWVDEFILGNAVERVPEFLSRYVKTL